LAHDANFSLLLAPGGDTLDDREVLALLKKCNAESSHAIPKKN
jgi:hypothetical protein